LTLCEREFQIEGKKYSLNRQTQDKAQLMNLDFAFVLSNARDLGGSWRGASLGKYHKLMGFEAYSDRENIASLTEFLF
jgi:hypothetical protein